MELLPGTYFELNGRDVEYVGVKKDTEETDNYQAVLRLNPLEKDEGLHTIVSLQDIEEKGKNFWNIGEKLTYPELAKQYEDRVKVLRDTGILHVSSSGEEGIENSSRIFHPLPSFEEVKELFMLNQDLIRQKTEQGFTRLQLTPMAVPMKILQEKVGQALRKHSEDGKLYSSAWEPSNPDVRITIMQSENPMRFWIAIQEVLETEAQMYFPPTFKKGKEKGITKPWVLSDTRYCYDGWSIGLIEENEYLKKKGEGKVVGGRQQLETGHTAKEYLEILQSDMYTGETGYTPEDFLIDFLTRLEETNHVMRSIANGNRVMLTGGYFPSLNEFNLPIGLWDKRDNELWIAATSSDRQDIWSGTKTAVRLGI